LRGGGKGRGRNSDSTAHRILTLSGWAGVLSIVIADVSINYITKSI